MTSYLQALTASNASDAIVQAKAEGWTLQYWQHSDGLDVIAERATPEDAPAIGMGDFKQLHTMLLCPKAAAAFRG